MAWLEQHPTSSRFKICFRWGRQRFKKTVKTTNRSEAQGGDSGTVGVSASQPAGDRGTARHDPRECTGGEV
jgi:hypothetical protein